MKVKDQAQWQAQLAEFDQDPDPMAKTFATFVTTWAEAAEQELSWPEHSHPLAALRATLRYTEEKAGRITAGHVGMALVVLGTHWELAGTPDEFFHRMTTIEQNLFADVAVAKLEKLNREAEEKP